MKWTMDHTTGALYTVSVAATFASACAAAMVGELAIASVLVFTFTLQIVAYNVAADRRARPTNLYKQYLGGLLLAELAARKQEREAEPRRTDLPAGGRFGSNGTLRTAREAGQ